MSVSDRSVPTVVLVGYEDQDNLGLRYITSRLRGAGCRTQIVTFGDGPEPVIEAVRSLHPHIVGFSLIYPYFVPKFAELLAQLRARGITSHFTIGGHYASFEPEALLKAIPELDSVVLFEGEDTTVELAERIAAGLSIRDVRGVVIRGQEGIITTQTRPGRLNLDELRWPDRDDIDYESQRLPMASIIGGRGCSWRCSFCSITAFYKGNGTKGRRLRNPRLIADEIEYLHRERGVRVLLWQDDDFLAGGQKTIEWAHAIARECVERSLHYNLRWKISCRSDEVKLETLEPLVEAGLTHVYLGVESGDRDSLRHLNKLLEPEAHFSAAEVLRRLGLSFDLGFMLLEPWSTLAMVQNNVRFLREFVSDGASVIGFCRMLPFAGTTAENQLLSEGRLSKSSFETDYSFLDPRLDVFYNWLLETFTERNDAATGTTSLLRLLLFETNLNLPDHPSNPLLRERVKALTAVSNEIALDIIGQALDHIERLDSVEIDDPVLYTLKRVHVAKSRRLQGDIAALISSQPSQMDRQYLICQ